MKNKIGSVQPDNQSSNTSKIAGFANSVMNGFTSYKSIALLNRVSLDQKKHARIGNNVPDLAEILVVTSYPPRECGIATYSQDLIRALNNKFSSCLSMKVCALETGDTT